MLELEADLQKKCKIYLRKRGIRFTHVMHRKGRANKDDVGLPDLIIFMPKCVTLFIELKKDEKQKLRKEQSEFKEYAVKNMYPFYRCWYLTQFIDTVEMFL